jgi:hypothetical protein
MLRLRVGGFLHFEDSVSLRSLRDSIWDSRSFTAISEVSVSEMIVVAIRKS